MDVSLPNTLAPTRRLALPSAARPDPESAVRLQLGELTPFPPDQLYFAVRSVDAVRADERFLVDLSVAPKTAVDDIIKNMEATGRRVARITVQKTGSILWQRPHSRLAYLPAIILTGTAIGAFVSAASMENQRFEHHQARLEQQVTLERKQAQKSQVMRRDYENALRMASAIQTAQAQAGSRLAVLEELARRTDDSIWFISLSMEGSEIKLSGVSSGATSPVRVLERSPKLTNVKATSATVADARLGGNRFEISADIVGAVRSGMKAQ